MTATATRVLLLPVLLTMLAGCATIPMDRYGVHSLRIDGTEEMSEESLRTCLSTAPRDHVELRLGGLRTVCAQPPFDRDPARVSLWAWPWTEWPLFDRVAFEEDLERIERWYAARGFHGARVVDTRVEPTSAAQDDSLPEDESPVPCEREDEDEGCEVDLSVLVEEGEPTLITEVVLRGGEQLDDHLREVLREAITLRVGERFDEWAYDTSKSALERILRQDSYALAEVSGVARVNRPRREARVALTVEPGPACVFGEVIVEGQGDLDEDIIRSAARIEEGAPFQAAHIDDAQRAIYSLGSFSGVVMEPVVPEDGNVIAVRVSVTPARRSRFGIGVGFQSGVVARGAFSGAQESVPQWDVHLLGRYTHRNFLGGLRQLQIEERPRIIVQEPFPGMTNPRFGNLVSMELRAPGTIEARTTGKLSLSHEVGPDPFDTFFRHRIDSGYSVERPFFFAPLTIITGIRNSIYVVPNGETTSSMVPLPVDSILTFLEQTIRLDYRDDGQRPHAGFFAQVTVHEAGYFLPSSWDYVHFAPDVRGYVPLPAHATLAVRLALGMRFITAADASLDPLSQQLGPRDFRMRGGGAASNRGFLPGRLGDGVEGGTRRWDASLELRLPLNDVLGVVVFGDAGDVSREERFRFDHPQVSLGGGLRLFTPIGTIRFDLGWRVPAWQVLGADRRIPGTRDTKVQAIFGSFPGASHITIGEAF